MPSLDQRYQEGLLAIASLQAPESEKRRAQAYLDAQYEQAKAAMPSASKPPVDMTIPVQPGFSPRGVNVKTDFGSVSYKPQEIPTVEQENATALKNLGNILSTYGIPTKMQNARGETVTDIEPYTIPMLEVGSYNNGIQTLPDGRTVSMPQAARDEALGLLAISRGGVPAGESRAIAQQYQDEYLPEAEAFFSQRAASTPVIPMFPQTRFDGVNIPVRATPELKSAGPITFDIFQEAKRQAGGDREKTRQILVDAGYVLE